MVDARDEVSVLVQVVESTLVAAAFLTKQEHPNLTGDGNVYVDLEGFNHTGNSKYCNGNWCGVRRQCSHSDRLVASEAEVNWF